LLFILSTKNNVIDCLTNTFLLSKGVFTVLLLKHAMLHPRHSYRIHGINRSWERKRTYPVIESFRFVGINFNIRSYRVMIATRSRSRICTSINECIREFNAKWENRCRSTNSYYRMLNIMTAWRDLTVNTLCSINVV